MKQRRRESLGDEQLRPEHSGMPGPGPVALRHGWWREGKETQDRRRLWFMSEQEKPVAEANLKSDAIPVSRRYMDSIVARLATVEDALRSLSDRVDSQAPALPPGSSHVDPQLRGVEEDGSSRASVPHEPADGMGSIVASEEEDIGYFGPSSNIAFTKHITKAISAVLGVAPSPATDEPVGGSLVIYCDPPRSPAATRPQTADWMFQLPPSKVMEDLIHAYFAETNLLYPYLHEKSFWDRYYETKATGKRDKTWLGLLNMVLAQATATSVNGSNMVERTTAGEDYYRRAAALCEAEILRGTSVEIIQVLLIMAQYLQGTRRSIKTWNLHGLAVKGAFQLGLHSQRALDRFPPLEKELRTRVWYACVMLDRMLSMTFGRPPSIPEYYIRIQLPRGYQARHVSREEDENDSLVFHNATIKLYKIIASCIEALYDNNLGLAGERSTFDTASGIFQMENHLVHWQQTLPSEMCLVELGEIHAASGFRCCLKLRVILTMRYHNARILTHRAVLDARLVDIIGSEKTDAGTLERLGPNSLASCVHSACAIVDTAHAIASSSGDKKRLLGAWWFSVYYVFNAALVIFASRIVTSGSAILSSLATIDHGQALDRATRTLTILDPGNKLAERCARFISALGHAMETLGVWNQFALIFRRASLLTDRIVAEPRPPHHAEPVAMDQHSNQLPYQAIQDTLGTLHHTSGLGMDLGDLAMASELSFLNDFSATGLFH
ncbi:hypothetical protein MKZ38_005252 [Zalerion maritima]|uniref:Xylanolytic transcriptional activator regulatory domain-containing protein n=1 Tax=Zalerion maritima TaxID=339359 RepID=A0AAD5RKN8_9PEZI|nr:hypothetical protein MKZ38_005252 [Zalerion maritima]